MIAESQFGTYGQHRVYYDFEFPFALHDVNGLHRPLGSSILPYSQSLCKVGSVLIVVFWFPEIRLQRSDEQLLTVFYPTGQSTGTVNRYRALVSGDSNAAVSQFLCFRWFAHKGCGVFFGMDDELFTCYDRTLRGPRYIVAQSSFYVNGHLLLIRTSGQFEAVVFELQLAFPSVHSILADGVGVVVFVERRELVAID